MNMNYSDKSHDLFQAVLESSLDGMLLVSADYEVLYVNQTARDICQQLLRDAAEPLPRELKRICVDLIESRELFPDRPLVLEHELTVQNTPFRVEAQWMELMMLPLPCVLLRLQDQQRCLQGLAMAEAYRWHLTQRETEVWILRRSGVSRKSIGNQLFIAEDTVKKHLKNIQMKRKTELDEEEWQSSHAC
jgi:DNA-binding CsgD family transcriptional regulator